MANLLFLVSQYEILEKIAQYLSTLDLFHLASTCSELYTNIRQNESIFEHLKCLALCDGNGLKARQEFRSLYGLCEGLDFARGKWGRAVYDEELEVRVWNLKCDAVNALPCLRCRVNVCEECRYVPRVRDTPPWRSRRRPHLDPALQSHTIICYCTVCDEKVERNLPPYLSDTCDCDQYTRWICLPCKLKEELPNQEYFRTRTKGSYEWDGDPNEGMWLDDNQDERAFWCPCGERAPKDGNIRCAWCMRKHKHRDTWFQEDASKIPFFDDDPCYPKIVLDPQTADQIMYPNLGYTGAIAP